MKALFFALFWLGCDDKYSPPEEVDQDGDGVLADEDCDDSEGAVHPGAEELCDGLDNDCDGEVDVGAIDQTLWYADSDGDGSPGADSTTAACEPPAGYGAAATDCDDADPAVHPDAAEVCGGVDDDCDGLLDEADPDVDLSTVSTWYPDADADGYGLESGAIEACSPPSGTVAVAGDCDDADPGLNPETWWYPDADADGYGDGLLGVQACERPGEWIRDGSDCFDYDEAIHPAATEVCNGADDDCDRLVDDADSSVDPATTTTWYVDVDQDGWGDEAGAIAACDAPPRTVSEAGDCDDGEPQVNPGAAEVCDDGLDNDCDGGANGCGLRGVLSTADADAAWTGLTTSDYLGQAQDIAGDLDGDGYDDALLGAYGQDSGGSSAGAVYLLYGGPALSGGGVSALPGWTGDSASDYLGFQVAGLGDLDGDGLADYGMGAYGEDAAASSAGAVYLVYGDPGRPAAMQGVASADAVLLGSSIADYAGHAVASGGDLDGDGLADALVGAYGAEDGTGPTSQGAVYVVYGGARLSGSVALGDHPRFIGESGSDYLGYRYSIGAGDFDADGLDDLALGAFGSNGSSTSTLGTVYVIYGDSARWSGSMSVAVAEVVFDGVETGGDVGFGHAVAGVGDFDGDGAGDLSVGGHYHDGGASDLGAVWLWLGDTARWSSGSSASADLLIQGVNGADYLGRDVEAVGDLDDDGLAELATGAYGWDTGLTNGGAALVWYGRAAPSGTWALTDADGRVEGGSTDGWLGYALGGGGDLNGDGRAELLAGAFGEGSSAGAVYLFLGGSM